MAEMAGFICMTVNRENAYEDHRWQMKNGQSMRLSIVLGEVIYNME